MAQLAHFRQVLRTARRQVARLFLLSFLINLMLLTTSLYMMQVFDRVLRSGSLDTLVWLTVLALLAVGCYGLLDYARRKIVLLTSLWFTAQLAPAVVRATIQTGPDAPRAGLADLQDMRAFLGGDAALACLDAPWTPLFLGVIWLMHPVLGMIACGGELVLFALGVLTDLGTRRAVAQASAGKDRLQQYALSYLANAETLRAMGMEDAVLTRWQCQNDVADAQATSAAERTATFLDLTRTIRLALQIMIVGAGAALVLRGALAPGGMIAASLILGRALAPAERAIFTMRAYAAFHSARRRLERLFDTPDASCPDTNFSQPRMPQSTGRLAVSQLGYTRAASRQQVAAAITFDLEPGQVCGVIGPSGSGKSSLCCLLVGAFTPETGTIRLGGARVATMDMATRGRAIGYLPQDFDLFSGTVAENIARMGIPEDEAVLQASRLAGAHDMIMSLPQGYATHLGPLHTPLSQGQKQRIGLARALYGAPQLVVLDVPEKNLDGLGEVALQQAVTDLRAAGRIVVLVTHAPALLRMADQLAVIQRGKLVAFGARDTVLQAMLAKGGGRPMSGVAHAAE